MKKNSSTRAPAFQFYPKDWLNDTGVLFLSYVSKGVWIDLLCYMFLSQQIGFLTRGSKLLKKKDVQQLLRLSKFKFERIWKELRDTEVLKGDETVGYYCKRMVEDQELRSIRRASGVLGGNPNLMKNLDNQTTNQNPTPSSSSSSSSSSSPSSSPSYSKKLLQKIKYIYSEKFPHVSDIDSYNSSFENIIKHLISKAKESTPDYSEIDILSNWKLFLEKLPDFYKIKAFHPDTLAKKFSKIVDTVISENKITNPEIDELTKERIRNL